MRLTTSTPAPARPALRRRAFLQLQGTSFTRPSRARYWTRGPGAVLRQFSARNFKLCSRLVSRAVPSHHGLKLSGSPAYCWTPGLRNSLKAMFSCQPLFQAPTPDSQSLEHSPQPASDFKMYSSASPSHRRLGYPISLAALADLSPPLQYKLQSHVTYHS